MKKYVFKKFSNNSSGSWKEFSRESVVIYERTHHGLKMVEQVDSAKIAKRKIKQLEVNRGANNV